MSNNPAYPDTDKTICLDFDGVIHDDCLGYHDGTVYGKPIEGSLDAIKEISEHGIKIIVCSTKARGDRPKINGWSGWGLIWLWLKKHKIAQHIDFVTAEKPPAFMYVDDKNWPNGARFNAYRWKCLLQHLRDLWTQQ